MKSSAIKRSIFIATITSFINLNLIIITKVLVLLGEDILLFGKIDHAVKLTNAQSEAYVNDFVQVRYNVSYEQ